MEAKAAPAESQHESPAESDREIKKIEHSGATLVLPTEVRKELASLSLADLWKRVDANRWARLKAIGRDNQIAKENMP